MNKLRSSNLRQLSANKVRLLQVQGKIRRFVYSNLRKDETAKKLALRQGECNRCGACCELLYKCPFLKKLADGSSGCGIYENRPNNCRVFPLDKRDLLEVSECSYTFIEKPIVTLTRTR